jgi:hypothetical protein
VRIEIDVEVDVEKLRNWIEEVKRQRVEEAKRLRLAEKCATIARVFGEKAFKGHGYLYTYRGADITIVYDDYGNNIDVFLSGRQVLDVGGGVVELYVPGGWIDKVEELYREAAELEKARRRAEEMRKLLEEAEKWGIDIKSILGCK